MSPYSQLLGIFPYHGSRQNKCIALTFDDGPNEPYTSQIVDYLNSKQIKASFFQVGRCVQLYPELSRKMLADGHMIGNHSLSHVFGKYFSQPGFDRELVATQKIFRQTLGKTPTYFRPPWLWRYPRLFRSLKAHDLQVVSGEFCHVLEVLQPSAERIARRAVAKAKSGAIIIFHDGYDARGGDRTETVAAVKLTVDELVKQGYSFVTIDQMFGKPAYR